MNKIFSILLLFTLSVSVVCHGQTVKQFQKKAQEAFDNQNYYAALTHYTTIVDAGSANTDIMYNYAEAARNYNAYSMAERSYEEVSSSERSDEFPLANYWLAGIKKNLGKYEEAKDLYTSYLSLNQDESSEFVQKAKSELEYLSWAQEIVDQPEEGVELEHLGPEVNTPYSEISPFPKEGELYYSSFRFENEEDEAYPFRPISKVLSAQEDMGGTEMDGDFNSSTRHTAHVTFNNTGERVYFTICDYVSVESSDISCQIYFKDKNEDGTWGSTMDLSDDINILGFTSTQPNLAYDKKTGKETLYFVSNRAGGKGGSDIWASDVDEQGNFGAPRAMNQINTPGDDISPFYHSGTATLYFSSNGRKNLGGHDIYRIEKNSIGWKEVEHLGFPINSSFNDIDYILNEDETEGYLASNRIGSFFLEDAKEACCNDIYKVKIKEELFDMTALTFNKLNGENLNGVNVELLEIKEILKTDSHADDNEYSFKVKRKKEYLIKASKPGFAPAEVIVSTDDIETEDIISKLYLEPYKMDLLAKVFDSENKDPLKGTSIRMMECNESLGDNQTNNTSNDYRYDVLPEKCYKLIVSKDGYITKKVNVKTNPLTGNITLEEDIFLDKLPPVTRLTLEGYLPLALYFDNDEPDKRSVSNVTQKTYMNTHGEYMARETIFKEKYSEGLITELKSEAEFEIIRFFSDKVNPAGSKLGNFTDHLLRYLDQGNVAEIVIRGYASPRAESTYNNSLTQRRISSIRNHFAAFRGGIFQKYIAQGLLKVSEAPYGETKVGSGVSDDLLDERNSIYSVPASIERRVEIIELK